MKIVVCGPPHSGKSVFLGGLCQNLPRDQRYLFRACPDGEGTWTWKGNGAEKFRRKGSFSGEIVDWYMKSLRDCKMAPIILVDVGGRMSKENRRIMKECDAAVILSGDLDVIEKWKEFCERECGLDVIAILHSDYHGDKDDVKSSPMVVHHLERGEDISRSAIQRVAEMILERVSSPPKVVGREKKMEFLKDGILSIPALAEALGKKKIERKLPNGRIVKQIVWEGKDLIRIAEFLHNGTAKLPTVIDLDGAAPAWLVSGLAHELHPRNTRLNSPDGFIAVGCRRPDGKEGKGIDFQVEAREGGWIVITFKLDPSVPLAPADLDKIAPPEVLMGAKVILSGRGPNWLTTSLVMGYHGRTKAVACFQPGTGATVVMTHSASVKLGEVIQ